MIKTKNLASSMEDVPTTWIFEHYLNLGESLTGQDVNIKSVFAAKDKNPSLFIYHSKPLNKYKFKDFAADIQGDGIELVKNLFSLPKRFYAASKIIDDYNDFVNTNGAHKSSDFKIHAKYKVVAIKLRNWNTGDKKYWTRFRITSMILRFFNVKPIDYFIIKKEDGTGEKKIRHTKIYGYFDKNDVLYKIYQPLSSVNKFFKVKSHIQGYDQLTFKQPYLAICSSLKDMAAFKRLGFKNIEVIAPDSENVLIPEKVMKHLLKSYTSVCCILDNDDAGIKAMQKYRDMYGIKPVHLKLEKDMADNLETHDVKNVLELILPLLTRALRKKN